MGKLTRLTSVPVALMLGACDVHVRDTTPGEMPANHDIGMYPVSATVRRDAMVSPGAVFLFGLGENHKFNMSPGSNGSQWQGLYEVRCKSSFPLQFLVEWRTPFAVKHKLVPPQPRLIRLTEPPFKPSASFDSSGSQPKDGWQGSLQFRFVTVASVRIVDGHVRPSRDTPRDAAAARPISVVTKFPLVAACGEPVEVQLASAAAHAHAMLVLDTDQPAFRQLSTNVEFLPQ